MEIFKQTNFDFLGKKWPFITLSLVLTAAGLVSLALKGGPKYGIDFTGGALMDVNFIKRPPAEAIRSALHKRIAGEVEVQEVHEAGHSQEALISTGVRDETVQAVRGDIESALNGAFNSDAGGRLDINSATETALVDRLRDPLQRAGVALSDDGLQALAKAIVNYRETHSGLITNLDQLSGVSGVTPQALTVLKAEC